MSIRVEIVLEEGRSLKEEVKLELTQFEQWFMTFLKNGEPLTRGEKAILNDYLGWKSGQVQG
jgi:hypothetical protein